MSTLLKDRYSPAFYEKFSDILATVIPDFDRKKFTDLIFDETWNGKELKDRMKHTSGILHHFMPKDFGLAAFIIESIIEKLKENGISEGGIEFIFFPDYIETFGIEHFESSVKSIEYVTQFISCEFAVRPFIVKYGDQMLNQMIKWSRHESHHVRRLASEGSRPRLPWAMALQTLKKNPDPIITILENLKTDPSEYVRRSVANSLNDIAKDNPHIVISIAKKWHGSGPETNGIVKHGCRTLLKHGNAEILGLYGLSASPSLVVSDFLIKSKTVPIGGELMFSFAIQNTDIQRHSLRLEYTLYFLRQNGIHGKKVFKISERKLEAGASIQIEKKHSFKVITTRRFYHGIQKLSIIVNGQERVIGEFELNSIRL